MSKMGAPPLFKDVKAFEACNPDGFFDWCEENGRTPFWEWFAVYMNCSTDTILRYMAKDGISEDGSYDKKQDFRGTIKRIGTRIIAELLERGISPSFKHDALMIFYLKNYGYTDKQEVQADLTVNLTIDGADNLFN